jgi:glycolate oxidase FAD binding subunit
MAKINDLGVEVLRDEAHRRLWEKIRDFGARAAIVLYRMTVPLSALAPVLTAIDQWSSSAATLADCGTGTIHVAMETEPSSQEWFSTLTSLARDQGGHAVMAAATPALKNGIDVWGAPPASLDIMRELKRRFDPHEILNPGRFIAGL